MKIGILGGTFDPVHNAHLALADAAYREFALDRVIFIPSGSPPHKPDGAFASDEQRIEMLRLAIGDEERYVCDLREIHSDRISYSYLTMEDLKKEYPDAEFYFIIGEDSLRDLPTWMEPKRLAKTCIFAAAARPDTSDIAIQELAKQTAALIEGKIRVFEAPFLDIASRKIRRDIEEGKPVDGLVAKKVLLYIQKEGLYLSRS